MSYAQNWNLDTIYPGGIHSPAFQAKLASLKQQIKDFQQVINHYSISEDSPDYQQLADLTKQAQAIESGLGTVNVFVTALISADYTNPEYRPYDAQIQQLMVAYQAPLDSFSRQLATLSDKSFQDLIQKPAFAEIAFHLTTLRERDQHLLAPANEHLLNQLRLDGLKGWSNHYDIIASTLSLPFTDEKGQKTTISAGQALNFLDGYPDAQARSNLMDQYETMWAEAEPLTADTLNHLAGARLTEQAAHGYAQILDEPLSLNHMSKETLDAMWQVVDQNKAMFKPYFARKAKLLGLSGIGWQDQVAPLNQLGDYQPVQQDYDTVAAFIIQNFAKFSPKMAAFAQQAFEKQWLEVEDRPGKQPGGWMESVPDIKESRIFLTFTGSVNDAATIAHELGHAFHSDVLKDLPLWRDDYAMNIAETASTFAELLIADANVAAANTDAEKVVLLDAKMTNPIAMFLNIRARFLFEQAFYQERQAGYVPAQRLNELMEAAQEEAFAGILTKQHPHFWSAKLHFYIDDIPFYNFPYTFGYLFSLGIYAWAKKQPNFEEAYISLLRDTANMSTEALAQKHLGVDLTQPDFWQAGADLVQADINQFMDLSAQFVD